MAEDKRTALHIAYNALMAIGAIDNSLHSEMWCIVRAQTIASEAMWELNTNHTADIQNVLGIGKRKKAGHGKG